jgi:hypothetical protein
MPGSKLVLAKVAIMKNKPNFLGLLLVVCWLLAACTTPGDSTFVESGAVVIEVATAVASPPPTIPSTAAPTNERIEHNGISFTYDPALFGDEVIKEFPASANQGLFDQPTPAHTRIGFASGQTAVTHHRDHSRDFARQCRADFSDARSVAGFWQRQRPLTPTCKFCMIQ